jgi:AmmeMemoRadiSam system protein B
MSSLGPNVAGLWYPDGREALARETELLIAGGGAAERTSAAPPAALIVPHAGWTYSGPTAGVGFSRLHGPSPERVVVVGPSHYSAFPGVALPAATGYITPLGRIRLDRDAADRLGGRPGVRVDDGPFDREHSLEALLPFLQHALGSRPSYHLVLAGAGSQGAALESAAEALAELDGPRTLWVVSSDFTHFGPRFGYVPFDDAIPERLRELDMGAVSRILELDREGFEDYVSRTGATICGRHAIDLLLRIVPRQEIRGELLAYRTSGEITGDWEHCVSYATLAFSR